MPAVGGFFGIPTYADRAVRNESEISFNAGSHRSAVHLDRAAWQKVAGVIYVDIAVDEWLEPPWSRSQGPER